MRVPKCVDVKNEQIPVMCKLVKAMYGLKQAPRCWNNEFKTFLKRFNFVESTADKCIFIGKVNNKKVYLILFVDDGLIAAKDQNTLQNVLDSLKQFFEITIAKGETFVGLQIECDRTKKTIYTKRLMQNRLLRDLE